MASILKLICVFFIISTANTVHSYFLNVYPKFKQEPITDDGDDPGVPLILTPLIEANKTEDARNASANNFDGFKGVTSYSGYFTVNKNYNSNLFFWFFPSQTDYENDPVVLWLQGGPGASSLYGLFEENGPFNVSSQDDLELRDYAWTKNHSVIYIDNPVGTGFSFTDDGGYCQNETQVGLDLYEALQQFFLLFPNLQNNDFYIAGESYAGKYVPALGYTIHQKNPNASLKINLKGLSMGNGFSDPVNQLKYDEYLYQIGLIDLNAKNLIHQYEVECIEYINNEQWVEAFHIFDELLLNSDLTNGSTLFGNLTGFSNYYNYLLSDDPDNEDTYMSKYIQRNDVRAAIHVGNATYHTGDTVEVNLMSDVMQSVAPWITELLSHYRVLIYNGQLDIIVAYPLTLNYLQNLQFSGADQYKTAQRYQWYVDGDLAGYFKQAGNLTEILVRNAGHMVPRDQPKWAFDLITRFTRNKPYN